MSTERKPLLVPFGEQTKSGAFIDGVKVVKPGEDGYDEALAEAERMCGRWGVPIPYAGERSIVDARAALMVVR